MKKILAIGILAIIAIAFSQQQASAWVNSRFGVGLNWDWQTGGNNFLWRASQRPTAGPGSLWLGRSLSPSRNTAAHRCTVRSPTMRPAFSPRMPNRPCRCSSPMANPSSSPRILGLCITIMAARRKSETRKPKSETNPNFKEEKWPSGFVISSWKFGFVSDFGFRISNFEFAAAIPPPEIQSSRIIRGGPSRQEASVTRAFAPKGFA